MNMKIDARPRLLLEDLLGRDGTSGIPPERGCRGGVVTPMGGSVGSRVRGVMLGSAGWPLDDGVTRPGRAVVAPLQAARAMVMPRRRRGYRLEVLGLVAAARASPQEVRAAAYGTGSNVMRAARDVAAGAAPAAKAPLELLQLGAVVLRRARHRCRLTYWRSPVERFKIVSFIKSG